MSPSLISPARGEKMGHVIPHYLEVTICDLKSSPARGERMGHFDKSFDRPVLSKVEGLRANGKTPIFKVMKLCCRLIT